MYRGQDVYACMYVCMYVQVYNQDITDLQYESTSGLVKAEERNQNFASMNTHYKG